MNTSSPKVINHSLHPILIGSILSETEALLPYCTKTICIISDETVAELYLESACNLLQPCHVYSFILPSGEQHKSWAQLEKILTFLAEKELDRSTTLIALGGGVITDLTGLAAALYRRGVHWVAIPTTLLSQADAAIGGKTAINFLQHKNMVGTFHLPNAILIDPSTLQTLPEKQFFSGFAEIIKHSLLTGESYFSWLEKHSSLLCKRDISTLYQALYESIQVKTNIVEQDTHDHHLRHLLNLGHTVGHALETASQYTLLHGEAVAIGLTIEMHIAQLYLSISLPIERVTNLLQKFHLPTQLPSNLSIADILHYLMHDKKITSGKVKLPLVHAIGDARLHEIEINELYNLLNTL